MTMSTFRTVKEIMEANPETFSQWLEVNNDSLPEPESFGEWLEQNNDSIEES